jgi:CRP-like cAMP-binding protein
VIRQRQYAYGPPAPDRRAEAALREIDAQALFGPLSHEERRHVAAGARLRRFGEGETIVREGDATSSMFLIAAGRAAVSVHGALAGDSRKVAVLEPGVAFGEISLLTGEPRTATVRALTEATLVEIDKATLAPILEANPSLVAELDRIIVERRRHTADRRAEPAAEIPGDDDAQSLGERIARFFGLKGA